MLEKCVLTFLELNWNQRLGQRKTKLNICHHMFTSSTQLQNWSFHVAERTRTSSKCQKLKSARAKRAKILFCIVRYANFWRFLLPSSSWLLKLPIGSNTTSFVITTPHALTWDYMTDYQSPKLWKACFFRWACRLLANGDWWLTGDFPTIKDASKVKNDQISIFRGRFGRRSRCCCLTPRCFTMDGKEIHQNECRECRNYCLYSLTIQNYDTFVSVCIGFDAPPKPSLHTQIY